MEYSLDVNKMKDTRIENKDFQIEKQVFKPVIISQLDLERSKSIEEKKIDSNEWKHVFHCLHYGKYFRLKSKCFKCPLLISYYGRAPR